MAPLGLSLDAVVDISLGLPSLIIGITGLWLIVWQTRSLSERRNRIFSNQADASRIYTYSNMPLSSTAATTMRSPRRNYSNAISRPSIIHGPDGFDTDVNSVITVDARVDHHNTFSSINDLSRATTLVDERLGDSDHHKMSLPAEDTGSGIEVPVQCNDIDWAPDGRVIDWPKSSLGDDTVGHPP